jgi:hypothetical protein
MATYKINLRSGIGAYGDWYDVMWDDISAVALADGWFVNYVSGATPVSGGGPLGGWPTSGSAAWVDNENAADGGHRVPSSSAWVKLLITGPANTNFDLDGYSNGPSGRFVEWRLNGGTSQNIEEGTNESVVNFSGTTDGSSEALLEYRQGAGSSGNGYANAIRITPAAAPASPTVNLDDSALEPGKAITGTYANYTSAPTVLTLTDSEGNTVSSASEITDLVIDDSAETYAFTMPDRITTGTGTTLLRGDITVELT